MPVLHESTTPAELAACASAVTPCAACRKRTTSLSGIARPRIVHSYGSTPSRGWVPQRVGLTDDTAPTFGVELETNMASVPYRTGLTGGELASIAGSHWHAQEDGSVSGPELASQPATLAYWRSIRPQVAAFMRSAIHGGVKSHDGDESCSMHVNIGKDAFENADHLARFIRLVSMNPRWTTALAQRTHRQMDSWATCSQYPDNASAVRYATSFMGVGTANTMHSAVVNLGNYGRVEFRAPRGTLRVDRFYAKLEWVAAMVEYTRTATSVSPGAFTRWAFGRESDYPEFTNMVRDIMPGRAASATGQEYSPVRPTGTPSPARQRRAAARAARTTGTTVAAGIIDALADEIAAGTAVQCAYMNRLTGNRCRIPARNHGSPATTGASHSFITPASVVGHNANGGGHPYEECTNNVCALSARNLPHCGMCLQTPDGRDVAVAYGRGG